MSPAHRPTKSQGKRTGVIIETLQDAFAPMMRSDPVAFRGKYRKMAADPHAFYRGTACLFAHDVTSADDPFARDGADRIWIHGDLHVENFGTYLNSRGRMIFDVNDFDEAYLGHFTWDLQRFVASLALVGWQKALPEESVRSLIGRFVRSYLSQVDHYAGVPEDDDFAITLDNAEGPVLSALVEARTHRRSELLDSMTVIKDGARRFVEDSTASRLSRTSRKRVVDAFRSYLETIPESKRFDHSLFYELRDVCANSGFGIGSAGLPAYNVLVEGYTQALENDVVLSMKQANVPALSRFVDSQEIDDYFEHEGHRTVVSQRALQVHTDPLLGYTSIDGVGYVVAEVSPYEVDLDWSNLSEPSDIRTVVDQLGRATAKIHCASDEDSEQDLVDFQVESAIRTSLEGRRREFTEWLTEFGLSYAATVRADHALFVEAFRSGALGVRST